ncbi:Uncharacterised protein [Cedecea neteri]|uniref:Uncharacterized protein n=1 Tax=Cedecea neteri TaxID=158822 RepID=A0A2X3L0G8_9ENTR|nr:Uncharacterised protein [Cedecea neteri]
MKLPLLASADRLLVSASAQHCPKTPLEPVYHQLFNQRNDLANSQLMDAWPRLNSEAQRQAWKEALDAVDQPAMWQRSFYGSPCVAGRLNADVDAA